MRISKVSIFCHLLYQTLSEKSIKNKAATVQHGTTVRLGALMMLEIFRNFQYNIIKGRNSKGMDIMNIQLIETEKDELLLTKAAYTVYRQCMYNPDYEAYTRKINVLNDKNKLTNLIGKLKV